MKKLKTTYLIIAIIVLQALGMLSVLPEIIPTWEIAQIVFVLSIYVVIIFIAVIIIVRIWKLFIQKKSKVTSILSITLITMVISGYLFFSFISNALEFGQGIIFPDTFVKKIDYPNYDTTIYIYDSGFLDPSTTIKVRNSWLPVMKTVKNVGFLNPHDLKIKKINHNIIEFRYYSEVDRFNLKTGKLIEKK